VIESAKSAWFNAWFARHARGRIRRTFGRVLVSGLADTRGAAARAPLLVVANHTTWWDALVALYVSELLLDCDGYAMMDASNLRRVPFFRRVGAFGVDPHEPADGARAIRHAAKLLDAPGRAVWIFPEGRERSPFGGLELRPGSAQIARVARRALVVPVGLRYVFGAAERPDLWISLGPTLAAQRDVAVALEAQRGGIDRELARITSAVAARVDAAGEALAGADGFVEAMSPRPSWLGKLAERVLARIT
jgi:1-acyl-sn-glycerol-3-phosphate acyltransferase